MSSEEYAMEKGYDAQHYPTETVEVDKAIYEEDETAGADGLRRGLKARHITMISIGGTIGTGLFIASGSTIANAGAGGALLAYVLVGIMVFFLMTSLGEMATYLPISGSFNSYGGRFFDEAYGFALSWNYWYSWAVTVAVELVAASVVMSYWAPGVPSWIWSLIFLVLIFCLNMAPVRGYGEAEYWFSLIKVITVIIFIIVGILVDTGAVGPERIGGKYFAKETFHNGFAGLITVFLAAGFSFQGTELVGIAAGESANPRKNVPRAIRQVFWRILLFYVLAIIVIGLCIPQDDPNLLDAANNNDITISPFTLVFQNAGLKAAASVMNAIILITVLSAGNSGLYAASRVLMVLSQEGKAPRFLRWTNRWGTPLFAVIATTLIGAVAFLVSFIGNGVVYTWLLNISGSSGFLAWVGISVSHIRFRQAFKAQGRDLSELPFRTHFYPLGPIFALVLSAVVILGQGYAPFSNQTGVDVKGVIAAYISIPLFLILWFGYKIVKKTKIVALVDVDLDTGRSIDRTYLDDDDEGKNIFLRIWNAI